MKTKKQDTEETPKEIGSDFFKHFWEKSWTYIRTVVDVVREPVLILDEDLSVVAANGSFYDTFQVKPKGTNGRSIYELGNGQWNIPALRKLLKDIVANDTFFQGFQVAHEFPDIGRKVMILNARRIHVEGDGQFPAIILLAIEDVTEMMVVAETLAGHAKDIEAKLMLRIGKLENEINNIKKKN